jgi:Flp pilus assembly protein TadG
MTAKFSRNRLSRFSFGADESGTTGIIFGLTFMPLLLLAGAGVDYTRYSRMRADLQQATDAAVLKVGATMTNSTTLDQARAQVQVLLKSRWGMSSAQITNASISADRQTFCADSRIQMETSFLRLTNLRTLSSSAQACANLAGGNDPDTTFEIALVLDNSGSMSGSTSGTTKLGALKSAATNFVSTMFTKAPGRVEFSITPFAGAVVAVDPTVASNRTLSWIDTQGLNSQHWTVFGGKTAANAAGFTNRFDIFAKLRQRNSRMDWRGCFEAPVYPRNVQDMSINTADAETLFVPYLAPDEPSGYDNNNYIDDNGGVSTSWGTTYTCSGTASGDWNKLSRACKYLPTASRSGSFGPTAFYGPSAFCPDHTTQRLMRLTNSQSAINSKISQLVANGNTNLHEGFMWGWRTISPVGPFADGAAYNAQKNRKVMVFMTDGFNNWGSYRYTVVGSSYEALGYYTYNGQKNLRLPNTPVDYQTQLTAAANSGSSYLSTSRKAQDALTLQACANAKAAGIEIFTIGFSTPTDPIDAQGLAVLQNCATNADHYFPVEDATELNAAFSTIGIGLGKLRLSL